MSVLSALSLELKTRVWFLSRLNPVEVLQRVEQNTRAMQEGLRELRQGVDTPNRSTTYSGSTYVCRGGVPIIKELHWPKTNPQNFKLFRHLFRDATDAITRIWNIFLNQEGAQATSLIMKWTE